ncbi:MAG: AMP-binding protein, partial [Thermoprotei archaeon]
MYYRSELTISSILKQTLHRRCEKQIVYGEKRYSWLQFYERVQKLAAALEKLGVTRGSKVAVVDIDTHRYLEAYYAIPMMGAVLHTVNIRLP